MKTKFAGKYIEKEIGEIKIIECNDPDYSIIKIWFKDDFIPPRDQEFIGANSIFTCKIIN
jgi:hypothetical protein